MKGKKVIGKERPITSTVNKDRGNHHRKDKQQTVVTRLMCSGGAILQINKWRIAVVSFTVKSLLQQLQ